MKYIPALLFPFFVFLSPSLAADADPAARWEKHIRKFEEADRNEPPQPDGILFVGSSSIRMWDTDKWFPGAGVINRGFGGSQISDVNYFAERIVLKYRPRVIAFYAGDNDVAKGKSPKRVLDDFNAFAGLVADELPSARVVYVPIKPSLARWKLWPIMREANAMIKRFIDREDNLHYADTATPMLGDDGAPRADLFIKDGLHLSDKGYELWSGIVEPFIEKTKDENDE
jgi:lysophospholipase L1-like esterase